MGVPLLDINLEAVAARGNDDFVPTDVLDAGSRPSFAGRRAVTGGFVDVDFGGVATGIYIDLGVALFRTRSRWGRRRWRPRGDDDA